MSNKYIYGLAASNDISTVIIYLALLYNNCTFLIFDPSILKNKNTFLNSLGLNKIISSIALNELNQNEYQMEKFIDKNLQIHSYRKNNK